MNEVPKTVWIFHGAGAGFSGAVFSTPGLAEAWIAEHRLSGTLTEYPLNCGVYDWAIASGLFQARNEKRVSPAFIGGFTSASQNHFHYEHGSKV
jgi:hypothetical protein